MSTWPEPGAPGKLADDGQRVRVTGYGATAEEADENAYAEARRLLGDELIVSHYQAFPVSGGGRAAHIAFRKKPVQRLGGGRHSATRTPWSPLSR